MRYFLLKTEPTAFSIDDLQLAKAYTTCWDGVRNYQARNIMRDRMQLWSKVLIYHSQSKPLAIMGIAEVTRMAYPDPTQFQRHSRYFDPTSNLKQPRWLAVDITWLKTFLKPCTRDMLKANLATCTMHVLQKGSRLSVTEVTPKEYKGVIHLAKL